MAGVWGQPDIEETPTQAAAESNADTVTNPTAETPVDAPPPPAEAPATDDRPKPNYSQYLQETSGGLITDEDDFKAKLEKVRQYDEIEAKARDLEAKVPKFKDDASRIMYEAMSEGNEEAVASYLEEKRRNYDTMSDIDAVKWALRKENPEWKDKDIDAEVRYKYGKSLEKIDINELTDADEIAHAEKINDAIDDKILLLERDSRDARIKLNKQKSTIELPKLTQAAPQTQSQPTEAELQAAKVQWEAYAEADTKLPDYKFTVDGEEVGYKVTEDERKAAVSEMKGFNAAEKLTELGWRDADGKLNPGKIAKDMHLIRNAEKLIKSAYSQGKTAGKKETVTKDIKNINLTPSQAVTEGVPVDPWQTMSQRFN